MSYLEEKFKDWKFYNEVVVQGKIIDSFIDQGERDMARVYLETEDYLLRKNIVQVYFPAAKLESYRVLKTGNYLRVRGYLRESTRRFEGKEYEEVGIYGRYYDLLEEKDKQELDYIMYSNRFKLVGLLEKDPKVIKNNKGQTIVHGVVVARGRKKELIFLDFYANGENAEMLANGARKGQRVALDGHIKTVQIKTAKIGNRDVRTLFADRIALLPRFKAKDDKSKFQINEEDYWDEIEEKSFDNEELNDKIETPVVEKPKKKLSTRSLF